ncbi:hypothetical protein RI129_013115 [Pyrocoelia pectoralis]|uniref:Chromo domain-containing protein n=1 Tax=Pyrocoelia pectoralis TaxID=417401 RepID=A0AAN7UVL9_9COLE
MSRRHKKSYSHVIVPPEPKEYTVERIIDKRVNSATGTIEYLLKWQGYSDKDNSWEPEENLDCPGLVEEFETIRRRKHEFQYHKRKYITATVTSNSLRTVESRKVIGFARGLQPERILACTNSSGQLLFLMQWANSTKVDLVPAAEANIRCPEIVIDFYERHIVLNTGKDRKVCGILKR